MFLAFPSYQKLIKGLPRNSDEVILGLLWPREGGKTSTFPLFVPWLDIGELVAYVECGVRLEGWLRCLDSVVVCVQGACAVPCFCSQHRFCSHSWWGLVFLHLLVQNLPQLNIHAVIFNPL